jgi:hypothetical protein
VRHSGGEGLACEDRSGIPGERDMLTTVVFPTVYFLTRSLYCGPKRRVKPHSVTEDA